MRTRDRLSTSNWRSSLTISRAVADDLGNLLAISAVSCNLTNPYLSEKRLKEITRKQLPEVRRSRGPFNYFRKNDYVLLDADCPIIKNNIKKRPTTGTKCSVFSRPPPPPPAFSFFLPYGLAFAYNHLLVLLLFYVHSSRVIGIWVQKLPIISLTMLRCKGSKKLRCKPLAVVKCRKKKRGSATSS